MAAIDITYKATFKYSSREQRSLQCRMDKDDDRCDELSAKFREAQALLHETQLKSEEVCCVVWSQRAVVARLPWGHTPSVAVFRVFL